MPNELHERWQEITPRPVPAADVVAQGDRVRRRRTTGLVAGLVALIVAVPVGVTLWRDGPAPDGAVVAERQVDPLNPPKGQRYVGANGVVVAVPEWWTTGETQCGKPVETTVYFDAGGVSRCPMEPSRRELGEVSSLAIQPIESTPSAGREVEVGECTDWYGSCARLISVPGYGVAFRVVVHDEDDGDFEAIRDSLTFLPDDVTTVPISTGRFGFTPSWVDPAGLDQLVQRVRAAGLVPVIDLFVQDGPIPDGADRITHPEGAYLGSEPELGTPVPVGSTVTIKVAGPPPLR